MNRYYPSERAALLEAIRELRAEGLLPGTSGNLSVRVKGGLIVTPTGVKWDTLSASELVLLDQHGTPAPGQKKPTSEWRIHKDIYAARADVNAVVHGHPRFTTALSCLREPLPAVHYMIAVAGTDVVQCAPYATFGSEELSKHVLAALGSSKACLLANHGMVGLGQDLADAVRVATEIERVADVWYHARLMGKPFVLGQEEMKAVHEKFATYGQQK